MLVKCFAMASLLSNKCGVLVSLGAWKVRTGNGNTEGATTRWLSMVDHDCKHGFFSLWDWYASFWLASNKLGDTFASSAVVEALGN